MDIDHIDGLYSPPGQFIEQAGETRMGRAQASNIF